MTTPRTLTGPAWPRLRRHYLEMAGAMIAGMAVLGPLETWLFAPVGWAGLRAVPVLDVLVMATNMTVAMVAWMWLRGHGWTRCAKIAALMLLRTEDYSGHHHAPVRRDRRVRRSTSRPSR